MKNKKTILIADDDEGIVDALTLMLEDEGYSVQVTYGTHTLSSVKKNKPDLILLDLWMAGINGQTICTQLKSNFATKHIPVIIISANKDIESVATTCNADDYLSKPFEMNDLLSKIGMSLTTSS